jgi:hypothetical protein
MTTDTDVVRYLIPDTSWMRRAVDEAVFAIMQVTVVPTVECTSWYAQLI